MNNQSVGVVPTLVESNAHKVDQRHLDVFLASNNQKSVQIAGYTAERIWQEKILDNPNITSAQINQIRSIPLASLADDADDAIAIRAQFPNYASQPAHLLAVDLVHIATGHDRTEISRNMPSLGLTGTPDTLLLYATDPELALGTVIHDFTDNMRNAKVVGINEAVWGVENQTGSALVMALQAYALSVTDIIPKKEEILNIIGAKTLPTNGLEMQEIVSNLGSMGGLLGTKLAIFHGGKEFGSQVISQTVGKTIGGWLGDSIAYDVNEIVGDSLPARALYTRLYGTLTSTITSNATSAITQTLNSAFDIKNPLGQIGVNTVATVLVDHFYASAITGIFDEAYAIKYFGVKKGYSTFNAAVIKGHILDSGFSALSGFATSQLFGFLDRAWKDVNLSNNGAAIGGILGGFVLPGIGNFLGQVIGGWIWDILDNEHPHAYYIVTLNSSSNSFFNQYELNKDGGRPEVAAQMSASAKDTLQLISGMIGGHATQIQVFEYGHYEEDFVYKIINGDRITFATPEAAVDAGIVAQLKTAKFEGGDSYMKWVASLSNYHPTLQQLFTDLGAAKEYSAHKTDPLLYGKLILNVEDTTARRYLLDDWHRIYERATALSFSSVSGNDGSEFIAGTVKNDAISGGIGNDFLYGDTGNDTLDGGAGNDRLDGGTGDDKLDGADGDDTLVFHSGKSAISSGKADGGAGNDWLEMDYSALGQDGWYGISNRDSGKITYAGGTIALTYSNIEHFKIIGGKGDDSFMVKNGDAVDGYNGKDKLYLDLSTANSKIAVDLTLRDAQVSYSTTLVKNFETIGSIVTGNADDRIILNTEGSSEGGKVDGGAGNDWLEVDYSALGLDGWYGISNRDAGKITYAGGTIALTYSNIEHFKIIGGKGDDSFMVKNGDAVDGYNGKDKLYLDLSAANSKITVDLTLRETQVSYRTTFVKNFETIGSIITGEADDRIVLNTEGSVEGGKVDGGAGNDWLEVDYSALGLDGWYGLSSRDAGKITYAGGTIALTYSNIEHFKIIGGKGDDSFMVKNGDSVDGYNGKDKLYLDLSTANSKITVDLTQPDAQVSYSTTLVKNFETIGSIITGEADDRIILNTEGSVEGGKVDGGAGNDWLEVDYSALGLDGWYGISNRDAGKITYAGGTIALTYSNIEHFKIIGGKGDDSFMVKNGDAVDGYNGKDKLYLDLSAENSKITVDLTQPDAQVTYSTTFVKNFETIGSIITGKADDRIILNTEGSSEGGKVDGGAGNDWLEVDYSALGLDGWYDISNRDEGKITYAGGTIALTYSNIEHVKIVAGKGNDSLYGGSFSDFLNGYIGADLMTGGDGDDTYVVDNKKDNIVEKENGGIDEVQSSISWILGTELENLFLTGITDINGTGNSQNNIIRGNNAANIINGGAGMDSLIGGGGNDTLNGGDGLDSVKYAAVRNNFNVAKSENFYTITGKNGELGTDTLIDVERIQFNDKMIALDIAGDAGKAYRLYQAAFDRVPDLGGLGFWINVLDNGASLEMVANGFVNSAEFIATYGNNASPESVVARLYNNVLHRAPDQGGFDFWVNTIKNGNTVTNVLASFSESPENQLQVIGSIQNGIEFIPIN